MTPLDRANLEILQLKERLENVTLERDELLQAMQGRKDEDERDQIAATFGFTPTEARAMQALYSLERPVSRGGLLDAIYFDRPIDLQPETKILDVLMSKCRRKMSCKEAIVNHWGRGYELTLFGRKLVTERMEALKARRAAA